MEKDSTFGKRRFLCDTGLGLLLLFLFALITAGARGEGARLAVIGMPELEKETLLLTAALSAKSDLEILERAEIAKVLQEQRLERQGLTLRDSIRLGGLINADGLVLLERTSTEICLRIMAVDSGAIVAFSSTPLPIEQEQAWSSLRAAEIARLAPKLRVSRSEVIPISLMRINSATGGTRGLVLEDNTARLLATRLSAATNIIVLERARLQDAVAEKEFGAEKGSFWNSAWVIDGTVTELPVGFSLDLRLQSPGGDTAHRIRAEAPSLAGLVEEANGKILQALGGSIKAWDSAKEAQRFGDEALWAASNGFWGQAAYAIEAAIALGESSPDALRWRWQCYNRLARNYPGAKKAGSFKAAEGKDRPGAAQIGHMTRSLELYREALLGNVLPKLEALEKEMRAREVRPPLHSERRLPRSHYQTGMKARTQTRFGKVPPTHDFEAFGNLPDWEGCSLLRAASRLILAVEKPKKAPDAAEAQALVELRAQIHALFDAMATTLPGLALIPSVDDRVPSWNSQIDPHTAGKREEVLPSNLHHTRLLYGRAWEKEPERHFAYVRECLVSDLSADPYFFQRTLHLLTERGPSHELISNRTLNSEKRKAGEALIGEKNLRCQVAGAFLLCRGGAPTQGLQLFERHKELLLNNSLSAGYITGAFRFDASLEVLHEENPGESRSRATGVLKELLIYLLDRDSPLTLDMHYALGRIQFTERQSAELLTAFKAFQERHPLPPKDPREGAVNSLLGSLAKRAHLDAKEPPLPSALARTSPLPTVKQRAQPAGSQPLFIDCGWLARNYDDADTPGEIRYALPAGDKIWLHVDFVRRQPKSIRRQFILLDLPSLQSRVIHRYTMPEASASAGRMGPTFACDGEGIYFWNGQGIRYVRSKEVRDLEVPELKRPYLWLVDGFLYAADEEGVILKIDPATGHYEIVASSRRRPAQNALDNDKDLPEVTRIYRGANGALAVKMHNRKVYYYREAERDWTARIQTQLDMPDLLAATGNAWDEAGRFFIGIHANELLKKRSPAKRGDLESLNPAVRYVPAQDNIDTRFPRIVNTESGLVSNGVLWSLLREGESFWFLKLDLSSGAFGCRPVEFSPEYQPSISAASMTSGPYRLIPTPAGVAIYAPNQPVLWFVPTADIPACSSDETSTPND